MIESFFTAAGTLLLVIGILILCYITTKRLGKLELGKSSATIRLLERVAVGQDKAVALVQAGDKFLLLGIASSQITLLTELDEEQVKKEVMPPAAPPDFRSVLELMKNRKK